jgi:hypothetical protein
MSPEHAWENTIYDVVEERVKWPGGEDVGARLLLV